ncbi:MAG: hypothetical protein HPY67_03870 [Syntrophaceae bacterium]|nr:hypothetical protein [Syntrophaceae bacterium]
MGKSDFLFARPNFISGIARLFDLAGTLNVYNESRTGEEADIVAFYRDWLAIGDDLRTALEKYRQGQECHG